MGTAQVTRVAAPTDQQADAVLRLREEVLASTESSPLSDHVVGLLHNRSEGTHFVQTLEDRVVGYAHLDRGARPVVELLVTPQGDALSLLEAAGAASGAGIQVWTRGERDPLNDLLPAAGYSVTRTLLQLRRDLDAEPSGEPTWPASVEVRTFRVGEDEGGWLAVNNAAFVGHPEQSGWDLADIAAREQESWFDPAGFFLAVSEGRVVGFHWTKDHGNGLGEVYVIGVDPSMQGKRLGEPLLMQGLRHLKETGHHTVLLYVEADNHSALRLYDRLGFTRWDTDRLFRRAD